MESAYIKTPIGTALLQGDATGVSLLKVLDKTLETPSEIPGSLRHAASELEDYFSGTRSEFTFGINPQGTTFQKSVWRLLREIPFGSTTSYMALSRKLGDEKAIRAVASANGKNPLWIIIPCHRVIGSNGSLTGYAGGLWRKQWLLDHENPSNQQSLF